MASPLSWLFQIYDRVSGPAVNISRAMKGMIGPTQGFEKELGKLQEKINNIKMNPAQFKALGAARKELADLTSRGVTWAGFRHGLFETIGIARGLYDVVHGAATAVYDLGKRMIDSAGFIERVDLALTAVTGSAAQARLQMDRFNLVGNKAGPLNSHEFTAMGADLLTRGYKSAELPQAVGAALDIGAMNPTKPGASGEFIDIITNMKEMGQFNQRALKSLRTLGISIPDVQEAIASSFGVKVTAVKKLMEEGKVSSEIGLNAIYTAITKKTGGPLGTQGEKAGKTVDGLLHKISAVPETLFEGLARSAGYEKFRAFLEKLADELSPGSPFFEQMQKGVTAAFDTVMDVFGINGPDVMGAVKARIMGIIDTARELAPAVRDFVGLLVDAAKAAAAMAGYIKKAVVAYQDWQDVKEGTPEAMIRIGKRHQGEWALASDKVNENSPSWKKYGQSMATGMTRGIDSALPQLSIASEKLASMPGDVVQSVNEIHSPSKVFERLGMYTAEGYAKGIANGAGLIDLATQRAIRAPGAPASSSGGRGVQIVIAAGALQIVIDGSGLDARELAEVIDERLGRTLPGMIASAGEQLAIEMGAA